MRGLTYHEFESKHSRHTHAHATHAYAPGLHLSPQRQNVTAPPFLPRAACVCVRVFEPLLRVGCSRDPFRERERVAARMCGCSPCICTSRHLCFHAHMHRYFDRDVECIRTYFMKRFFFAFVLLFVGVMIIIYSWRRVWF